MALRDANKPIGFPKNLKVQLVNHELQFDDGKNTLRRAVHPDVNVTINDGDNTLVVSSAEAANPKTVKAHLGTTCSHIKNMIEGLSNGYKKELLIFGTGYKAKLNGRKLVLSLGYSHDVSCDVPEEINIEMPSQTEINLQSHCKDSLGQFTDYLLRVRKLCRYKGKGIRDKSKVFVAKDVRKS